jgi:hypothetical protein
VIFCSDLGERSITLSVCQVSPLFYTHKPTQFLLQTRYKYTTIIDILCVVIYNGLYTQTILKSAMSYYQLADTQKQIRITLNLSVDDDFIPENINWTKLLELNDYETVESIIEAD